MTDPNMPPESPIAALTVCLVMLVGFPVGIWIALTWTRQRWAALWRYVKAPPSHVARDYATCLIHGQRIPAGGDCAVCVEQLYTDLNLLERGEPS